MFIILVLSFHHHLLTADWCNLVKAMHGAAAAWIVDTFVFVVLWLIMQMYIGCPGTYGYTDLLGLANARRSVVES